MGCSFRAHRHLKPGIHLPRFSSWYSPSNALLSAKLLLLNGERELLFQQFCRTGHKRFKGNKTKPCRDGYLRAAIDFSGSEEAGPQTKSGSSQKSFQQDMGRNMIMRGSGLPATPELKGSSFSCASITLLSLTIYLLR